MTNIEALLNPMSDRRLPMPLTPIHPHPNAQSPASPRKKQKLTKDAAIFQHGPIRGICRFAPDEYQDDVLAAYHQQFEISPFGEIADFPRHIPYNSGKKDFQEKTGRDYLEVFQYTFKKPGDETVYTMLWDYNIGLVRTTPLFKCTGYSKTTPAKVMTKNPGLKDMCHSITGGALVAQGYWIPLAAARALALRFCYEIRYALTPVFGKGFPQECIKPNADGFGDMIIDPMIIRFCKEELHQFRVEEAQNTPRVLTPELSSRALTPNTPHAGRCRAKPMRPLRSPYESPEPSAYDSETASDDSYTLAPSTPRIVFRDPWAKVTTNKTPPRSVPHPEQRLASPRSDMYTYRPQPTVVVGVPLTPPFTPTSLGLSIELSPKAPSSQQVGTCSLPRTSREDLRTATESDSAPGMFNAAIAHICTVIGFSRAEVLRRLGLSEEEVDAALTMCSLRDGEPQKEIFKHRERATSEGLDIGTGILDKHVNM